MNKRICLAALWVLLAWFSLDMTGFAYRDAVLVTQSYASDGAIFLIYLALILLFIYQEKIGKWLMLAGLSLWLTVQLLCHEWYMLFDYGINGHVDSVRNYFSQTLQWTMVEQGYIPDVYHTILHVLLVIALVATVVYVRAGRGKI